jgi:ElaB/YqjD/DUF883 family membrane-anchored ribosome-binding protein
MQTLDNLRGYLRGRGPRTDTIQADLAHRALQARDAVLDAGHAMSDRGAEVLSAAETFTRREPVKALSIALAVGALAVLILTSNRPTRHEQ